MRAWLVLLFLPLAGCLGGGPTLATGYFDFQPIQRGDPAPVAADDCATLLDVLNERADRHARVQLAQSLEERYHAMPFLADDMAVAETAADGATSTGAPGGSAPSARDADVTGTNNQESGVDEADILKTDGEWTYVLHGNQVIILHSETVGNLTEFSRIDLEGRGQQMFLERGKASDPTDDRLLILSYGRPAGDDGRPDGTMDGGRMVSSGMSEPAIADSSFYYDPGMARVLTYDLGDRQAPNLVDEFYVEGNHVGARLVDGTAYVVVHQWQPQLGLQTWAEPDEQMLKARGLTWEQYWELSETARLAIREDAAEAAVEHNRDVLMNVTLHDHIPQVYTLRNGVPIARSMTDDVCQRFLTTPDDTGRSVSTIAAIDLAGDLDHSFTQIVGGHPIVYGARDALVLAAASQNDWWFWAQPELEEATNLHWFDLDGLDVDHRASGRVDGIVQDQFGIDVHGDQLRVATTTGTWGRWWLDDPEPMMNHVAVFREVAGRLVLQGMAGPIAPDERIWSARFTDDRAYIVTFEQIDPLWIIDLSGDVPRVLGELEIPGVSTYIHPLSDDALLTIGYGPGEGGTGLDRSRIQVSLFDISDTSDPQRADALDIAPQGGWSWSSATQEHKAFTYWADIGKLAVPVSTHQDGRYWNGQEWEYRDESHIGLRLIDVDTDAMDLSLYGSVDQDALLEVGDPYEHYYGLEVHRSYFLGFPDTGPVSVYALSGLGMTAHDLETLEDQDGVRFGPAEYGPYY